MNHYQRLKIARDAPPEVIRAAYRALATKLHPDRQGANTGPTDALHGEMAALNAAYETLIDPKLRADYDATLATPAARPGADDAWFSQGAAETERDTGPQTRVDMDWLNTEIGKGAAAGFDWRRGWVIGGGAVGMLLLVAVGWAVWSAVSQRQVEAAITRDYNPGASPARGDVVGRVPPALHREVGGHKPSAEELAGMSDEELVKALPKLDEDPRVSHSDSFAATARHPLDGTPLRLRTETMLVDPLAAAPAPKR